MNKYFNPIKYYNKIQYNLLKLSVYKLYLRRNNNKTIYLFSVPLHENLGDQAIVNAQIKFLNKFAPEYNVEIIYEGVYELAAKIILGKLQTDDIVAIHGGGNMGDVWEGSEIERENIISKFKDTNNRIISFPQSYNFTNTEKGKKLKERANDVYSDSDNLTLFARENLSFKNMKNNFNVKNQIEFVPDIVFSLNKRNPDVVRKNIMTVLRSDREILPNQSKTDIVQFVSQTFTNINKSDTTADSILNIISNKRRDKLLTNKWLEFSSSKVVITDRLHGMVFAYITGTPAIVFDNKNHKVKNSYIDWLNDVDYIHFADEYSTVELQNLIKKYMNTDNFMGKPSNLINDNSYAKLINFFQKK
ncbi:polysaccharide pyruvyl transferase family protein [Leuconostoc lactis]|uniref:polysaccharide pyruvyl transferase family protein n=1 Tax=Leuconostoc lactis TaxID=1246 RepID=UPI0006DC04EA|nr:polysaccharide pyruvyl transferase family protein [Leuconostoc lactis]KQB82660.1 hypothetical protein AN225_02260 [Leuconostoc lactis]